jgi:hypothetical protein
MLKRWWRLDGYDRARIWKHYGLFCGLMLVGSSTGAASFAALTFFLVNYFKSYIQDDEYDYAAYSRVRSFMRLLRICIACVAP